MILCVVQETTLGQRNRSAVDAAHAEHRDAHAGGERLARGGVGGGIGLVGDQHQRAAFGVCLFDQAHAPVDRRGRVVAVHRHGVRRHRVEQIVEAVRVGGQRRNDEGLAGVTDQRIQASAVGGQQLVRLEPHAVEPARRHVARQHVPRQRDRQHLRRPVDVQRLLDPVPARPGQRQRGQQPGQREQPQRKVAVARLPTHQRRQQGRIDQPRQGQLAAVAPPLRQRQQRQADERQQPPRTQEMELLQQFVHAAASRTRSRVGTIASNSNASAASNGQRNSSWRGRKAGPCRGIGSSASMVR